MSTTPPSSAPLELPDSTPPNAYVIIRRASRNSSIIARATTRPDPLTPEQRQHSIVRLYSPDELAELTADNPDTRTEVGTPHTHTHEDLDIFLDTPKDQRDLVTWLDDPSPHEIAVHAGLVSRVLGWPLHAPLTAPAEIGDADADAG